MRRVFLAILCGLPKTFVLGGKYMKKSFKVLFTLALLSSATGVLLWSSDKDLVANTHGRLQTSLVEDLQASPDGEVFEVMVVLKDQADLTGAYQIGDVLGRRSVMYRLLADTASRTQKDLVHFLESKNATYRQFYIVNMVMVKSASKELIMELAKRSDVQKIYNNPKQQLLLPEVNVPMDMMASAESSIESVGATRVWSELGVNGQGVVVAGQDTGIQWDHPALKSHYRGFQADGAVNHDFNWYDAIQEPIEGGSKCGYASKTPCDDNDHGTHTIGTVAGAEANSNNVGMAPGSQWIGCRNMDAGTGRPHTYIACFEFLFAPYPVNGNPFTDGRPDLAAHVINNSWGCPNSEKCEGDVMLPVLARLKEGGIFVVVSAGNDGPGCKTIADTPAWHSAATFSVGAYDHRRNTIAFFSSRGPSAFDGEIGPDIVAPGVNIRSAVSGNRYNSFSGTSMAGPHVAGLVALMWSANPKLVGEIDETARLMIETADPIPSNSCMNGGAPVVPNNVYGHGEINAFKAVQAAMAWGK